MFSERTNWRLAQNRFTRALEQAGAAGAKILDLTVSNPTRAGLHYGAQAILGSLGSERALDYDPQPKGLLHTREAVASYYHEDHGVDVDSEHIILTTSTSEGYSFVFRLICNAGDELLVPKPSYPLFEFLADLQDVKLVPYPLIYDHGWQIDFHSLERSATTRTRGVVVVHPNNPTGSYVKAGEAELLNAFCRDRALALIVDEVFLDYCLDLRTAALGCTVERLTARRGLKPGMQQQRDGSAESAAPPKDSAPPESAAPPESIAPPKAPDGAVVSQRPASFAGNRDALTFALSGLSKIAALPQMKVAWVVTSGPASAVVEAMARLEVIADTYLSMNASVQWAVPVLLEQRKDIQRQLMARVCANLAELDRQLRAQKACQRLQVDGGWYAVLRVPVTMSDEDLAIELIREHSVLVHPGHFYDFESDGHLIVSLITPEKEFAEGVAKVLKFIPGI